MLMGKYKDSELNIVFALMFICFILMLFSIDVKLGLLVTFGFLYFISQSDKKKGKK